MPANVIETLTQLLYKTDSANCESKCGEAPQLLSLCKARIYLGILEHHRRGISAVRLTRRVLEFSEYAVPAGIAKFVD
jgi:hypothetical protein